MSNKTQKTKHQHKNANHNLQVKSVKTYFGEPKVKTYDSTDLKI